MPPMQRPGLARIAFRDGRDVDRLDPCVPSGSPEMGFVAPIWPISWSGAPICGWRSFVAAIDRDGNELSGIHLPDLTVPLATYAGCADRASQPREAVSSRSRVRHPGRSRAASPGADRPGSRRRELPRTEPLAVPAQLRYHRQAADTGLAAEPPAPRPTDRFAPARHGAEACNPPC